MAVDAWARVVLVGTSGVVEATWVVAGPDAPGLAAVDLLARAQLAARRGGGRIVVVDVCAELAALLDLAGLVPIPFS